MKIIKIIAIFLFAAALFGCAPIIVPAPTPDSTIDTEARSLTIEKEGIKITVISEAWNFDPIDVKYTFTPFYIQVTNDTDETITLGEDYILMFDENSIQYGVVSAEDVERAMTPKHFYPPIILYGGNYYYHDFWGWGLELGYPLETYDSEIIPRAFRFGPIAPHATARGFVYLQEADEAALNLTLKISPTSAAGEDIPFTFNFTRQQ
jgi:hypothetical protein